MAEVVDWTAAVEAVEAPRVALSPASAPPTAVVDLVLVVEPSSGLPSPPTTVVEPPSEELVWVSSKVPPTALLDTLHVSFTSLVQDNKYIVF